MIQRFIELCAQFWRATLFVLFFLLAAGGAASYLIAKETNPDISFGAVYISLRAEGFSASSVVDTLIKPIEDEVRGLTVVDVVDSTAYDDGGNVVVQCLSDVDPDVCTQEVRAAVDNAEPNLADSADAPSLTPINISDEFPTIIISLFGNVSPLELKAAAEFLQEEIEKISGVEEAEISGARAEQTEIIISPTAFEDYGLTPSAVVSQVINANASIGVPRLTGDVGETALVVDSGLDTLADVYDITLLAANDAKIRLGDVAQIIRTFEAPDTLAQVNGQRSVTIDVKRKAGSNVRQIAGDARTLTDIIIGSEAWNPEIKVTYTQDSSILVNQLLGDLINAVAISILLVLIVIVAVLGLRTGILVGIAIPGSMMIGILFLFMYGATMNIVVMFSLILASGMLVDGAIVVTEYADRQIARGMSRQDAYVAAAKRMALPIISSTVTTLVVFAPLLFWGGIIGAFMSYLPLTLIVTLAGSLLMALLFVPVLGEHLERFFGVLLAIVAVVVGFMAAFMVGGGVAEIFRPAGFDYAGDVLAIPALGSFVGFIAGLIAGAIGFTLMWFVRRGLLRLIDMTARDKFVTQDDDQEETALEDFKGATGAYIRVLRGAISTPFATLGAVASIMVIILFGYTNSNVSTGFFPEVDPEQFIINVKEIGNLSIAEKEERAEQVQELVFDMQREYGEIANFRLIASGTNPGEDTIASIDIELTNWSVRMAGSGRTMAALEADLRDRISGLFTSDVELALPSAGPPTGKDVQVQLTHPTGNIEALETAARLIRDKYEELGLVDIDDQLPKAGFETHIVVDEARAAERGISKQEISQYLALATSGLGAGDYRPEGADEESEIKIRYEADYRNLFAAMNVNIISPFGPVPLRDIASVKTEPKAGIIRRQDGDYLLTPAANVAPGSGKVASDVVAEVDAWLQSKPVGFPDDVIFTFRGAQEEQDESFAFLLQAMVIAIFIMFLILIVQFNSFYHASLILIAVVMSIFGVLLGLTLFGGTFNLMAGIGIISLAGIVVNNNIVLIDTFQQLRRDRQPKTLEEVLDVIMLTGAQRLRPVMLTTVTTILGLLPMALGINIDFTTFVMTIGSPATQWWADLARAVVYGITFATVLTLVVTPAALAAPALLDKLRGRPIGGIA